LSTNIQKALFHFGFASKIHLKSEENPKKKQRTVNGKLVHSPHGLGVSAESTTFAPCVEKVRLEKLSHGREWTL